MRIPYSVFRLRAVLEGGGRPNVPLDLAPSLALPPLHASESPRDVETVASGTADG